MIEKLIELLENSPYLDVLGGLSYWEEAADNLIANGVTIPVRCQDCKHWDDRHCSAGHGWCSKIASYTEGTWFCADQERKENEKS